MTACWFRLLNARLRSERDWPRDRPTARRTAKLIVGAEPLRLTMAVDGVAHAHWLERAVIGLNLCPFAKAVHVKEQVHYAVSTAIDAPQVLAELAAELDALLALEPAVRDTTLLIVPGCLGDFLDFNDFLAQAERLLRKRRPGRRDSAGEFSSRAISSPGPRPATSPTAPIARPIPRCTCCAKTASSGPSQAFPQAEAIYEANIGNAAKRLGPEGWAALDVGPGPTMKQEQAANCGPANRSSCSRNCTSSRATAGSTRIRAASSSRSITSTSSSRSCCWSCRPTRGRSDAGRPWRRQVVPRFHPLRPVLQGARQRPYLRHRDPARAGGEVARAGRAAGLRAHVVPQSERGRGGRRGGAAGADRRRHRAARLRHRHRRRDRLRAAQAGTLHGAGAVLPGRSRGLPARRTRPWRCRARRWRSCGAIRCTRAKWAASSPTCCAACISRPAATRSP